MLELFFPLTVIFGVVKNSLASLFYLETVFVYELVCLPVRKYGLPIRK